MPKIVRRGQNVIVSPSASIVLLGDNEASHRFEDNLKEDGDRLVRTGKVIASARPKYFGKDKPYCLVQTHEGILWPWTLVYINIEALTPYVRRRKARSKNI